MVLAFRNDRLVGVHLSHRTGFVGNEGNVKYLWLIVALGFTGCRTPEVCAIKYRDCCLVEGEVELKLKGVNCWQKGSFIFQAGEFQSIIDQGKKAGEAKVKTKGVIPE